MSDPDRSTARPASPARERPSGDATITQAGRSLVRSTLTPYLVAYVLLAALWAWLVWAPAPQVVPNGDGGNVASMAAGWLDRGRFAHDPVLATPQASRFYMALTVPLTMLFGWAIGDIGSGYIVQIAPLLFAQLAGFHLLGLRLFRRPPFAAALALLSVPPVIVFSGELWGMLDTPLTRSFAGAALPWILMLLVGRDGTRPSPARVMAACGATVYLHPVSAPALAAGCWLAMLADRPIGTSWPMHARRMVLAGLVFVVLALPFALVFVNAFPGSTPAAETTRAEIAATLNAATGPAYYDVRIILLMMWQTEWAWRWYVWGTAVAALVLVPFLDRDSRRPMMLIALFLVGVIVSSIGVTALDQWLAAVAGRNPVQLDLVRNVRFVVPILLLLAVWLAATLLTGRSPGAVRSAVSATLVLGFTAFWWHAQPTPVSRALTSATRLAAPQAAPDVDGSRMLSRIRALPPHSRILPIAMTRHGPMELVGLAVRYAAFQPVVFHEKDINLLSYSGSEGALEWSRAMSQFAQLRNGEATSMDATLARIIDRHRPDYLLVHEATMTPALRGLLHERGRTVATEGPWQLMAASKAVDNPASRR